MIQSSGNHRESYPRHLLFHPDSVREVTETVCLSFSSSPVQWGAHPSWLPYHEGKCFPAFLGCMQVAFQGDTQPLASGSAWVRQASARPLKAHLIGGVCEGQSCFDMSY